jgi:hypothetical protein
MAPRNSYNAILWLQDAIRAPIEVRVDVWVVREFAARPGASGRDLLSHS